MSVLKEISDTLMKGKADETKALVQKAIDEQVPPGDILNDGLLKGMSIIGERFKKNEAYVPEVLIAARAMKSGMEILKPVLVDAGIKPIGTVVIGTVKGDLHDIGKNLVCMMLEGAGFKVIDAGINVEAETLIKLAQEHEASLIGASALLTTTMTSMKTIVEALQAANMADKVKLMVGGAPVTQDFANEIGADGYAPDAASAADLAKSLLAG